MRGRLAPIVQSGALELVVATGMAGVAGYLLTLLAGIELGPANYVAFGVLWSSLFFAVGTLNGLQQEVARATRSTPPGLGRAVIARDATLVVAATVLILILSTSVFWVPLVFSRYELWLALPLAIGLAGHTIATALVGMLHGLRRTRLIAAATVTDAALRFVGVLIVLLITHDIRPISWALIAPYLLMPFLIWSIARRQLNDAYIDVNRGALLRHAGITLLAAAASGSLISGISLLIAGAAKDVTPAHVGAVIFAINITRAPLIIVVGALQNLIVVRLRDRDNWLGLLARIFASVTSVALALAFIAALIGRPVIAYLMRGEVIDSVLIFVIVGSGGLVALMSVTGAAIIARGRHSANTVGWVVAAITTVTALFAIPNFDTALAVSLLIGPITGLLVHFAAIAIEVRRQDSGVVPSAPPDSAF